MDERYPGGESPEEFYNRIIRDFKRIILENESYKNIIIVTHSGVINIIYSYINNIEWSNKMKSIKISNDSIFSLILEENKKYFDLTNYIPYLKE